VIAGNDNLRRRESVQKLAGLLKLALFRALSKIAGNHDNVGSGFGNGGDQGLHGGRFDAAEVGVR